MPQRDGQEIVHPSVDIPIKKRFSTLAQGRKPLSALSENSANLLPLPMHHNRAHRGNRRQPAQLVQRNTLVSQLAAIPFNGVDISFALHPNRPFVIDLFLVICRAICRHGNRNQHHHKQKKHRNPFFHVDIPFQKAVNAAHILHNKKRTNVARLTFIAIILQNKLADFSLMFICCVCRNVLKQVFFNSTRVKGAVRRRGNPLCRYARRTGFSMLIFEKPVTTGGFRAFIEIDASHITIYGTFLLGYASNFKLMTILGGACR